MGALEPVNGKIYYARVGSDEWSETLSEVSLSYDEIGDGFKQMGKAAQHLSDTLVSQWQMSVEFQKDFPDNQELWFLLIGKPQKWMYPRARQFRAARRRYRRWRKAQTCT